MKMYPKVFVKKNVTTVKNQFGMVIACSLYYF